MGAYINYLLSLTLLNLEVCGTFLFLINLLKYLNLHLILNLSVNRIQIKLISKYLLKLYYKETYLTVHFKEELYYVSHLKSIILYIWYKYY